MGKWKWAKTMTESLTTLKEEFTHLLMYPRNFLSFMLNVFAITMNFQSTGAFKLHEGHKCSIKVVYLYESRATEPVKSYVFEIRFLCSSRLYLTFNTVIL